MADPDPKQIEATRARYPAELASASTYPDHRELLLQARLDAVEIATPHTQHAEQITDCLRKGLHVLCEKPLTTTVADAYRVVDALAAARKVGMVSYQRHYQSEFRHIRERIRSGEFGKVMVVQALLSQEWKRFTLGTWRQDPALSGGGQLLDSGSHMLDILLWTTGLAAESVSAQIDPRGTAVDIDSSLSIRFEGGAIGSICIAGDAPNWHEDLTIFCERGAFFMRGGRLSISHANGDRFAAEHLAGGSSPDRNFIDAILGRAEVESPFECGVRVIELTEAAWRSAEQSGAPVRVA